MMRARLFPGAARQAGFSVVELLVSVVIGMLALMFATRLITGGEQNKQAALGGSDAMQNGMLAMFSITNDANQAGYGLNDPILAGCDTSMDDSNGFALAPASRNGAAIAPLGAVVIQNNGLNSDRISFYAGGALAGTASVRLAESYTGGNVLAIDREPYGFNSGDVIVVAPEQAATKCSLAQVSAAPVGAANKTLRVDNATGMRFNRSALGGNLFAGSAARVFNLGPASRLAFHTWSVQDGYLQLRATDMAGSTGAAAASVADNIVAIKAQYGFDTAPGTPYNPENGAAVRRWSSDMEDVDGIGGAGSTGDFQRVVALRVAVVARSKAPERPRAGAACSATTVAPVLFGAAQPAGVTAVPVSVNLAVAGDSVDWRCYRYRVFETIVPLRNAAWRPTAWPK